MKKQAGISLHEQTARHDPKKSKDSHPDWCLKRDCLASTRRLGVTATHLHFTCQTATELEYDLGSADDRHL
jgi:hypothetical protein